MSNEHEKFMAMAIAEARKGLRNGEQPFGSVVVRDGNIVGRAFNVVNSSGDPTTHAEVNAVRDASANMKTPNLADCTLYTSCDPCPMCSGAIMMARIGRLFIGARSAKLAEVQNVPGRTYTAESLAEQMHTPLEIIRGVLQDDAEQALTEYDWSNF